MIYKYLSIVGAKKFFEEPKLRFSNCFALNDVFECCPVKHGRRTFKQITEDFQKISGFEPSGEELSQGIRLEPMLASMSQMVDHGIRKLLARKGLLCVSEHANDYFMWSHYGSGFAGVVIGFNEQHEFFCRDQIECGEGKQRRFAGFKPVEYLQHRTETNTQVTEEQVLSFIYSKTSVWAYEKEHRACIELFDTDLADDLLKYGLRVDVPVPQQAIEQVILGPGFIINTPEEEIGRIAEKFSGRLAMACPGVRDTTVSINELESGDLELLSANYRKSIQELSS